MYMMLESDPYFEFLVRCPYRWPLNMKYKGQMGTSYFMILEAHPMGFYLMLEYNPYTWALNMLIQGSDWLVT